MAATLVLVPGLLCDETVWQPLVAALPEGTQYHVARIDTQETIPQMARDTLAAVEGPLMVAGHSLGGRVALEMWRQAPERIERIALLDTGVHPFVEGEQIKRLQRVQTAQDKGMQALADDWLPPFVHAPNRADTAMMAALTEMVLRKTPEIHERQIMALINRPDASAVLATIDVPALVLTGEHDTWSPPHQVREIADAMPDAELVIVDDAGHFCPLEKPDVVTAALLKWMG